MRGGTGRRTVDGEVRQLMRAAVAVALVLLVANVGARLYLLDRLGPQVDRMHQAAYQLDRLHAGMVDEETGDRGYLAAGSAVFLEPYRRAVPVVTAAADQLSSLLPSGSLTHDLLTLERARQRWVDEWSQQVPAVVRGMAHHARIDVSAFLTQGKVLFDRYRAAHDALSTGISARVAAAENAQRTWLVWSGVLQAVVALAAIAVSLAARGRISRRITQPVELLATTVSRITSGDLSTTTSFEDAPEELLSLHRDVQRMAQSLREQMTLANDEREQALRHGERLATVLTAAREIAGSLSLRYVMTSVANAARGLGSARVRIWLLSDDEHSLALSFDSAAGPRGPEGTPLIASGTGLAGRAVRYGRPAGPEPVEDGDGTAVAVPLTVGGRVIGALECFGIGSDAADLEVLEALAGQTAGAVASAVQHQHLAEVAVTDALTQLSNRRAFDEQFPHEVARSMRYQRPLSVISIDLDHFKALNDRHGHAYGDLALQQCSDALRAHVRDSDHVYRMGGEEIVVVCPETPADHATVLAERLRQAVEAAAGPDAPVVTASFGIAELPGHAIDAAGLLAAADRAMYAAKHNGRNTVVVASTPTTVPQLCEDVLSAG